MNGIQWMIFPGWRQHLNFNVSTFLMRQQVGHRVCRNPLNYPEMFSSMGIGQTFTVEEKASEKSG